MDGVNDQWLQKKFMINQYLINWAVVYKTLFLKSFVIGKFKCTCPFFKNYCFLFLVTDDIA